MSERQAKGGGEGRPPGRLHSSGSSMSSAPSPARLSPPVDVGRERFEFKPVPVASRVIEYRQPWSGYTPLCTLEDQEECRYYPVQTANIKPEGIYRGIEVEGDSWMRLACQAARESVEDGGGPFAAVVVQIDDETDQILRYWINHNQVVSSLDPTAHAEIMAIRSACASLGVFDLGRIEKEVSRLPQPGGVSHCVIYSSAEPCPMCFAAICWANIPMLLFAATRFDAAAQGVGFSDEAIYEELSRPYSQRSLRVYQCTVDNSLDSFNLWKVSPKIQYSPDGIR
ncbi:MAG: nucleoside deaminase [Methanothrix sp.]|uniref:nucleoside deaminase n=1 Tax=Methanothrix sp. TaxID=90426 RepID=UPI0026007735|nr:nucleoside deaminase [Methanothrix sp.]MBK7386011.1 nucleoside deaminase [Methanothrix sp.]HPW73817.1 nucleoside deaminase [Methanothrix sp.]